MSGRDAQANSSSYAPQHRRGAHAQETSTDHGAMPAQASGNSRGYRKRNYNKKDWRRLGGDRRNPGGQGDGAGSSTMSDVPVASNDEAQQMLQDSRSQGSWLLSLRLADHKVEPVQQGAEPGGGLSSRKETTRASSGGPSGNQAEHRSSGEAETQTSGNLGQQPCGTASCKFVCTWHPTHCCKKCLMFEGREHGTKCAQRLPTGAANDPNAGFSNSASSSTAWAGAPDPLGNPRSAAAVAKPLFQKEWQEITAMPMARHSLAVAVTDSAVYCIGGIENEKPSSVVERFWGAQGWDSAYDLPAPRHALAATALAGSIFVAGGGDDSGSPTNTAWRMNLRRGKKDWKEMMPMQAPRMHLALIGHESRVYAIGGADVSSVEYFDVEDLGGPWLAMPGLHAPRKKLAAVALRGVLYAFGGTVNGLAVASVEAFDTHASNKWNFTRNMFIARHSFGAAAVSSQHICIAGGCGFRYDTVLHSASCFDTETHTWSREVQLPHPMSRLALVGFFDGDYLLVFGGSKAGSTVETVYGLTALPEKSDNLCVADTEKTKSSRKDLAARWKERQRDAAVKYEDPALLARIALPDEVPGFNPLANGLARDWNHGLPPLFWGRSAKHVFWQDERPEGFEDGLEEPDVNKVMRFFELRKGPNGRPIRDLIGEPEKHDCGWWRCAWKSFPGVHNLPGNSSGEYACYGQADWQRAWHGCKFEALYSIMYHGRLFASDNEALGHRLLGGSAGVYLHNDATGDKVSSYFRFVPLCRDGVFWASKWEVYVDRADRVVKRGTDQWVQQPRSVRLSALWLCGRTVAQMQDSVEVARWWDPLTEANPLSRIWIDPHMPKEEENRNEQKENESPSGTDDDITTKLASLDEDSNGKQDLIEGRTEDEAAPGADGGQDPDANGNFEGARECGFPWLWQWVLRL